MGRRTYQMLASLPEEHRDEGWEQMAQLETVVFSHTLERAEWPNARVCRDDLAEEVEWLKTTPRYRFEPWAASPSLASSSAQAWWIGFVS